MDDFRWFKKLSCDRDHLAFKAVRLFYFGQEKRNIAVPVPVAGFPVSRNRTLVIYQDFSANIREDDSKGTLSPDPFELRERVGLKSFSMDSDKKCLFWKPPFWMKKALGHKLPVEVAIEAQRLAKNAFSRELVRFPKSFEQARVWQVVENESGVLERITNEASYLAKILDLPGRSHSIDIPTYHLGKVKPFKDFIVQADGTQLRSLLDCLNDPDFANPLEICFGRGGHQYSCMMSKESKPISAHRRLVLEAIARRHA